MKKYGYKLLDIFNRSSYYHEFKYPKTSGVEKYGNVVILTDENETQPINPHSEFSFAHYSDAIISIINGSYQKCSIALYGEWGTCKTTVMKWELIRSYFPRYKDIIIWLDVNSRFEYVLMLSL
ncbi:MAG: hypothetical protein WB664_06135 [Nitrososphaeraceae archaeon]